MDAHIGGVALDDPAGVDGHAQPGPVHLAGAGPAPELGDQLDDLGDAGRAQRVAPADQAAARVDGQPGAADGGVARPAVAGPASPGSKKPSDSRA